MGKHLLLLVSLLPIIGCPKGDDTDPMEIWYQWQAGIESNPVVSKATLSPSKGGEIHIDLELDFAAIASTGTGSLDTGLTREICEESPFPVELWISIPEIDRKWYGMYDNDKHTFVPSEYHTGGHPDLLPEYRVETGTFIIYLPSEG